MKPVQPEYQAYYCEENVWRLCSSSLLPGDDQGRRIAIFVANEAQQVALWSQRAALFGDVVVWDYHVVMARRTGEHWYVWDMDCRLGCPVRADRWIEATFPVNDQVQPQYQPAFRLIEARRYTELLRSDRSHMRDSDGQWLKPPPPWQCPGGPDGGSNVLALADVTMVDPNCGELMQLGGLITTLCG